MHSFLLLFLCFCFDSSHAMELEAAKKERGYIYRKLFPYSSVLQNSEYDCNEISTQKNNDCIEVDHDDLSSKLYPIEKKEQFFWDEDGEILDILNKFTNKIRWDKNDADMLFRLLSSPHPIRSLGERPDHSRIANLLRMHLALDLKSKEIDQELCTTSCPTDPTEEHYEKHILLLLRLLKITRGTQVPKEDISDIFDGFCKYKKPSYIHTTSCLSFKGMQFSENNFGDFFENEESFETREGNIFSKEEIKKLDCFDYCPQNPDISYLQEDLRSFSENKDDFGSEKDNILFRKKIKKLDISNCCLQNLDVSYLRSIFPNLTEIDASYNMISSIRIDDSLSTLKINLHSNSLRNFPETHGLINSEIILTNNPLQSTTKQKLQTSKPSLPSPHRKTLQRIFFIADKNTAGDFIYATWCYNGFLCGTLAPWGFFRSSLIGAYATAWPLVIPFYSHIAKTDRRHFKGLLAPLCFIVSPALSWAAGAVTAAAWRAIWERYYGTQQLPSETAAIFTGTVGVAGLMVFAKRYLEQYRAIVTQNRNNKFVVD